jgi:hypothetical protein
MSNPDETLQFFKSQLSVVNIGIEKFTEHLPNFGVKVIQVDWKPPSEGKQNLMEKLMKLKRSER